MRERRVLSLLLLGLALCFLFVFLFSSDSRHTARTSPAPQARPEGSLVREYGGQALQPGVRTRAIAFSRAIPAHEHGTWTHRGPFNVGGRTRAFAIDVSDEAVLLAGGVTGGLWRSEDGGDSWQRATGVDHVQGVTCLVQDTRPDKTNLWYYGSGEATGSGFEYGGNGVYKSIDGGRTWAHLTSTRNAQQEITPGRFSYIWNIALDPSNLEQDEVYIANSGALHRSVDGGDSWEQIFDTTVPDASLSEFPTDVAVTSAGTVYFTSGRLFDAVSEQHGIWRSPDGLNWTEITPPTWPADFTRIVIGINPTDENVAYFLANTLDPDTFEEAHSLWRYTYRSGDGAGAGGTWENLTALLPDDFVSQAGYDLVIKVKPDDPNVVYMGGVHLYRTIDGFASAANTQDLTRLHVDQHTIAFRPSDPDVAYVGNDGGVYRTTHDRAAQGLWTSLNAGYATTQFYTIAVDHGTPGSPDLLGGTQDNGTLVTRSSDPQTSWREVLSGDGKMAAISDEGTYFYVTHSGSTYITRYKMTAQGERIFSAYVQPASVLQYLRSFVLDPNDTNVMYMAAIKEVADGVTTLIVRQDDLAAIPELTTQPTTAHWTELTSTSTLPGIRAMAMSTASPPHRIYYALLSPDILGQERPQGRLMRLDDAHTNTANPVEITDAFFPAQTIEDIAIDPRDGDKVLVVFPGYEQRSLFYSSDAGQTWTDVGGNLEAFPDGSGDGPSLWTTEILPLADGRTLFLAGGTTGLFSTTQLDGAATKWEREATSAIGYGWVRALDARVSDGFVAVATHGDGVFTAHLDAMNVAAEEAPSPSAPLTLEASYPSPFNTVTTIPFTLSQPARVTLTIHDVQGRTVARLVSGSYSPGHFAIPWDATSFASGLYFYRLQIGASVRSRQLIVVR